MLELGAGTGLNMPHYAGAAGKRLAERAETAPVPAEVVTAPAEQLPFEDGWQHRSYRPWRAFAYGCRCNQDTLELIGASGLRTTDVEAARWRGMPPVVHPVVYGSAEAT